MFWFCGLAVVNEPNAHTLAVLLSHRKDDTLFVSYRKCCMDTQAGNCQIWYL